MYADSWSGVGRWLAGDRDACTDGLCPVPSCASCRVSRLTHNRPAGWQVCCCRRPPPTSFTAVSAPPAASLRCGAAVAPHWRHPPSTYREQNSCRATNSTTVADQTKQKRNPQLPKCSAARRLHRYIQRRKRTHTTEEVGHHAPPTKGVSCGQTHTLYLLMTVASEVCVLCACCPLPSNEGC